MGKKFNDVVKQVGKKLTLSEKIHTPARVCPSGEFVLLITCNIFTVIGYILRSVLAISDSFCLVTSQKDRGFSRCGTHCTCTRLSLHQREIFYSFLRNSSIFTFSCLYIYRYVRFMIFPPFWDFSSFLAGCVSHGQFIQVSCSPSSMQKEIQHGKCRDGNH